MSVKPIPDGCHSVTPYLIVDDAASAIAYYAKAFNAVETMRLPMGDKIGHAEIRVGDSAVMLADAMPDHGYKSPGAYGGTPVSLMVYVEDVDAMLQQAVDAGATIVRPIEDQFYGDRTATIADPSGHVWTLATHIEDVSEEEIQKRMAAWTEKNC